METEMVPLDIEQSKTNLETISHVMYLLMLA